MAAGGVYVDEATEMPRIQLNSRAVHAFCVRSRAVGHDLHTSHVPRPHSADGYDLLRSCFQLANSTTVKWTLSTVPCNLFIDLILRIERNLRIVHVEGPESNIVSAYVDISYLSAHCELQSRAKDIFWLE
ncbi:UNVERIFIED_CONTAM: hypothetical protein NCL1_30740 [Trichonephila clavipes]